MTLAPQLLAGCHRRALAAAGRLRLPLRTRVWQGRAGEFLGAGTGSSLDFQDHRSYLPGDDPRHINWQAYARTGQFTMKLYREEVRPVVDLVADVSQSMFYQETRARRAVELLYLAAESALHSGADLAVHLVHGAATVALPPAELRAHRWPGRLAALRPADPGGPPRLDLVPLRANSARVFLSDLLFPGDPGPLVRVLTARHGSATILCPFLDAEARPAWSGNHDFLDVERATRHPHRIEPPTLRRYLAAYAAHFALWKDAARRHRATLARIPAEPPLEAALVADALPAGALETA